MILGLGLTLRSGGNSLQTPGDWIRRIHARFKGHELPSLVEAILQAGGKTTYRSPAGADGGADILAGGGERVWMVAQQDD